MITDKALERRLTDMAETIDMMRDMMERMSTQVAKMADNALRRQYTTKEAAAYLNCSTRTVLRLVRSGELTCYQNQQKTRNIFLRGDLDEFLRSRMGEQVEPSPEARAGMYLDSNPVPFMLPEFPFALT